MTSETYPLNPIDVYFDITFTPIELYLENITIPTYDDNFSYLEITMQDNGIYSNTAVTNQVIQIIQDAFKIQNCRLGQSIKS